MLPKCSKSVFQHTAARRRLATSPAGEGWGEGFNTQPPEGGCGTALWPEKHDIVSTHSRPKAAAVRRCGLKSTILFQHTAARRRLPF